MLTPARIAALADLLRLMGDPSRLAIVLACLETERAVGELAAELGLSQSLTSHHLRLLREARVVRARRDGKRVFYTAADDHVRTVVRNLVDHVAEDAPAGTGGRNP